MAALFIPSLKETDIYMADGVDPAVSCHLEIVKSYRLLFTPKLNEKQSYTTYSNFPSYYTLLYI